MAALPASAGGGGGEAQAVPADLAARLHQLDRLIPAVLTDDGAAMAALPPGPLADAFAAGVSLEDLRSERAALAA